MCLLSGSLRVFIFGGAYRELVIEHVVCCDVSLVIKDIFCADFGVGYSPIGFAREVAGVFVCYSYVCGFVNVFPPVLMLKVRRVGANSAFGAVGRLFRRLIVSAGEGSLVLIVRVVIVRNRTCKRPFCSGDERFHTLTSPLFFNMFLCRFFGSVFTGWDGDLFFRILQLFPTGGFCHFFLLLLGLNLYLFQDRRAPRLVRYVRIGERVVRFALVINGQAIYVTVRLSSKICGVPGRLVKNVGSINTVFVSVSAFCLFAVGISP